MEPVDNRIATLLRDLLALTRQHHLYLLDSAFGTARAQAYVDGAILDIMVWGGFTPVATKHAFQATLERKDREWTQRFSQVESELESELVSGLESNGGESFISMASSPDGEIGTNCLRFVMRYSHLSLRQKMNLLQRSRKVLSTTPSRS